MTLEKMGELVSKRKVSFLKEALQVTRELIEGLSEEEICEAIKKDHDCIYVDFERNCFFLYYDNINEDEYEETIEIQKSEPYFYCPIKPFSVSEIMDYKISRMCIKFGKSISITFYFKNDKMGNEYLFNDLISELKNFDDFEDYSENSVTINIHFFDI